MCHLKKMLFVHNTLLIKFLPELNFSTIEELSNKVLSSIFHVNFIYTWITRQYSLTPTSTPTHSQKEKKWVAFSHIIQQGSFFRLKRDGGHGNHFHFIMPNICLRFYNFCLKHYLVKLQHNFVSMCFLILANPNWNQSKNSYQQIFIFHVWQKNLQSR